MYGGINDPKFRKDMENPYKRYKMKKVLIEAS